MIGQNSRFVYNNMGSPEVDTKHYSTCHRSAKINFVNFGRMFS